jgi:hypothetical protein
VPPLPGRELPLEHELHGIVVKALSPQREGRFPSAQTMLRELEAYVGRARLMASHLKLGEWMRDNFGQALLESRKARERAARAIDLGPAVTVEAFGTPPPPFVVLPQQQPPAPLPAPAQPPAPLPAPAQPTAPLPAPAQPPALQPASLQLASEPPVPAQSAHKPPRRFGPFAIWFVVGVLLGVVAIALLLWK